VARHSGGVSVLRIEDTDTSRQVVGAAGKFGRALYLFGTLPEEGATAGTYWPYRQSERRLIYLSYVRELMRQGKAYPCFTSKADLEFVATLQREDGEPTGYYGKWAEWREASTEIVMEYLEAGRPYVVRFRSPGRRGERVRFTDVVRGEVEMENNANDVVILKSSDGLPRLPTYHFAHVVDDHLMRVNLVIRGDEWLSSVPLHLQLFNAIGVDPVEYAHIAPLMKQEGTSRRKLSKREDPEAAADFYLQEGYPAEAVLYYLRGLANSRLAAMPLEQALAEPINLAECGAAGPLVDLVKLEDISADYIATLPGSEVLAALVAWAAVYDPGLMGVLYGDRDMALRALDVERVGVDNPRKDLRKWSDFRAAYGFFFDALFTPVAGPADERLGGVDPDVVVAFAKDFMSSYQDLADPREWFGQIRELAGRHGFARTAGEYKTNPGAYCGSIKDAAQLVRVALTGSTTSPNLFEVAQVLGGFRVIYRMNALVWGR
jgi:glutamyl-tRNA synthetase